MLFWAFSSLIIKYTVERWYWNNGERNKVKIPWWIQTEDVVFQGRFCKSHQVTPHLLYVFTILCLFSPSFFYLTQDRQIGSHTRVKSKRGLENVIWNPPQFALLTCNILPTRLWVQHKSRQALTTSCQLTAMRSLLRVPFWFHKQGHQLLLLISNPACMWASFNHDSHYCRMKCVCVCVC